jgi:hypothetical protein
MVSRARLKKRSDRGAWALGKKTFGAFCLCVLVFLSITTALIVLNPGSVRRAGDVSVGLLTVLGRGRLFLPVTTVPKNHRNAASHDTVR